MRKLAIKTSVAALATIAAVGLTPSSAQASIWGVNPDCAKRTTQVKTTGFSYIEWHYDNDYHVAASSSQGVLYEWTFSGDLTLVEGYGTSEHLTHSPQTFHCSARN